MMLSVYLSFSLLGLVYEVFDRCLYIYERSCLLCNIVCRMLSMYSIRDEDIDSVVDQSQLSETGQSAPLQMQLPVIELLKVLIPQTILLFRVSLSS